MTPKRLLYRLTRSGGAAIDPITYPQRAKPFGAAVRALRGVTLLTVRTTTGLDCYVMAGAKSADQADRMADTLAHTLAAKAERTDELPDLSSAPAIARLFARPTQSVSRDSQSGAEPAEVPQTILRVAEPGSWIAVTLRAPRRTEVDRARRWNARRASITTHHSLDSEVLVASFVAGGPSERSAAFLLDQMVSALPGMDVDTRAKAVTDTAVVATAGALAALVYGTGAALSTLSAGPAVSAAVMVTELLAEPLWAGAVASAPLAAIAMFGALGWLPTARRSLSTGAKSLSFPAPTAGGRRAPEPTPDKPDPPNPYPLAATSFLVGPSVVAAVAAPHAGAASGSAATAARSAPPALRQDIGAMIGHAGPAADQPVHLSAGDATSGLMVLGIPDSGKSVLIRSAYAWNVLERVAPSGKPGRPGVQNTLIAFENKGEGAVEYQRWTDALGDDALRFDLADKTTPAIDLLAGPATAAAKAKQVAEAMAYAFPEGDIRRQSLSTLTIVMAAAQFVDDRVCEWTQTPAGTSVVEHAATLLGSDGEAAGVALAVALKRREMAEDNPQLTAVLKSMNPLYGEGVTPAQRRGLQDAPRTKIETLVEARDWFDPARPRVSWAQLLTGHENVIINAGVSDTGEMVSTEVTTVMSSMLLFTLRDAIQRHCSGWKDQGRSVSIFVDELSLLAAGSPEVITWLRNQGRAYGICQYLATQYPDQLHDQVRKAVLSFGSVFWFRQSNSEIAKMAADMLGVDGSSWDRSDIFNLPAHTAVLISQVNKEPQPAVPVAIGYWEPERRAYPGTQGYPSPEATLPRDRPWLRGVQAPVPDSMVQVQDVEPSPELGPPADLPTADPFDPRQFETPEPR